MNGSDEEPGIIPQTIKFLYDRTKTNLSDSDISFALSMFEIYNSELIDLLDTSNKIGLSSNGNRIENLKKVYAFNGNLVELWTKSIKNRKTKSTIGNSRSSRSHAITQIEVKNHKNNTSSIINLVDLAGSESAKTTENINETKAINSSLSALAGVILSLKRKAPTVDYNQCILTKILKPSISGKSKTLLITNLTTTDMSACLKTLTFASTMANVTH